MQHLRLREIPVWLLETSLYSDGEGGSIGIRVFLWCAKGKTVGGYNHLSDEVREVCSRAATAGNHYEIFNIEAVGPPLILHNWRHSFALCIWLHFIDNGSALATLTKGDSLVLSGGCIAAYDNSRVADFGLWS